MWPFKKQQTEQEQKIGDVVQKYKYVQFSKETAEVNPDMIVREYQRLVNERNKRLIKLTTFDNNSFVFIPIHKAIEPKNFTYYSHNSEESINDIGYFISIDTLRNAFVENKIASAEQEMDVFEFIAKKKEYDKIINNLNEEINNIQKELNEFKHEFIANNNRFNNSNK